MEQRGEAYDFPIPTQKAHEPKVPEANELSPFAIKFSKPILVKKPVIAKRPPSRYEKKAKAVYPLAGKPPPPLSPRGPELLPPRIEPVINRVATL